MTHAPKLPTGLSPSSMDLYHQCPRRFEEEKMKGLYSPPGVEALLGTFVHRILELLMQYAPDERTLDNAKECARLGWPETEAEKDFIRLNLSEDAKRKFRWDAWTSVQNYFEMENPVEVDVVSTEQRLEVIIDGVPLRGIIDRLDRVDGKLVVSDYKNGKVPDKKYFGPKRDQLNLYAAMINAKEGTIPDVGRLIFTAHSQIIDVEFTPKSVAAVEIKTKTVWTEINEQFAAGEVFRPNTGPLCGWCPLVDRCPEGKAFANNLYQRGRLKATAPAYAMFANGTAGKIIAMPRREKRA